MAMSSTTPSSSPFDATTLLSRLQQGLLTSLQMPVFHQPTLWPAIVLLAFLMVLGLKGLGHWLTLWYGILGLSAWHHAAMVIPIHRHITTTAPETHRHLFGQILIAQTLQSLVFSAIGWAIIHYGLGITGPLSYSLALLCGSLPFANTMLALSTAQNLFHFARWQLAAQLATLLGGMILLAFWVWPLSQAHIAWLLVASHVVSACIGLLAAGFIGFDDPNPLPLIKDSMTTALNRGAVPVALWLLNKGVIIATAIWIGPTTAAVLAVLDALLEGTLPNALPNFDAATYHATPPTEPFASRWAPTIITLASLMLLIIMAASIWIGPGHHWTILGLTLWLSIITLLRHSGGHVTQTPWPLWLTSIITIVSLYWLQPYLHLITPLCLWTLAWGVLHLLPAPHPKTANA